MAPTLLSTKLYIPPYRPNMVARPRLAQKLENSLRLDHKLTLLSAPAGFGKTTLVTEWLKSLASELPVHKPDGTQAVKAAWLSLDAGDNDLASLLAYLVAALKTIDPAIGKTTLQLLENNTPPPAENLILPLVNDLSGIPGPFILVLDDYHTIQQPVVHQALAFLIDRQPQQMHMIITTRQDPLLPLSRWRARGQLTEIRLSDLRFTEPEAADFLNRSMGLNLMPKDIAALEARTEGWIAGLQLAAISLQQYTPAKEGNLMSGFIQAFTGNDRFVMDYLIDEVLGRQPEEVQNFLLHTSILERFNASLCEAVLLDEPLSSSTPIQNIIDYLDRSNLFLIPLDNHRDWYRYHHLFAELLRYRLKTEKGSGVVTSIHQKAARWFAENGFTGEAVSHAVEAKDYHWLADLLEKVTQNPVTWSRGEFNRVLRWLEVLPLDLLETRPMLLAQISRVYYMTGDSEKGLVWLEKSETAAKALPPSPETDRLLGIVALNWSFYYMMWENIEEMIIKAEEAMRLLPESDLVSRGRALYALALGNEETGELLEAKKNFELVNQVTLSCGNLFLALNSMCSQAYLMVRMGQLEQAESICHRGMELGLSDNRDGGGRQLTPANSMMMIPLGFALYERNELEAAEKTLLEAIALAEQGGITSIISTDAWLPIVIWCRLAMGNLAAALEGIQQFDDFLASAYISPHQHISYEAQRAYMALALGDTSAAIAWARRYEQIGQHEFILENPAIVLVRVYIFEKRFNDALSLLEKLLPDAEKRSYGRSVIEINILLALTLRQLGQQETAMTALQRAVKAAAPAGYIRLFTAEGEPMRILVEDFRLRIIKGQIITSSIEKSEGLSFTDRLLSMFAKDSHNIAQLPQINNPQSTINNQQSTINNQQSLIEPLTDRELEVLQMIADGLSHAEIAKKLYLSPNTLKAHTQNIYSKMEVHSRLQAVNKARELGLLK